MKVLIGGNFVIPCLEGKDEIEIPRAKVTLKTVLEELSSKSSRRMNFIDNLTGEIDYLSYHITVNEESPSAMEASLDGPLKNWRSCYHKTAGALRRIKITPENGFIRQMNNHYQYLCPETIALTVFRPCILSRGMPGGRSCRRGVWPQSLRG